jgi:hypothetical protein
VFGLYVNILQIQNDGGHDRKISYCLRYYYLRLLAESQQQVYLQRKLQVQAIA